jgi:transcription elongation factor/antiterminator RfaH
MLHAGVACTGALAPGERWFLVHTHPKSEHKAELHLRAQGFRTYLPRVRKTVRHARQLRTVTRPLFPRYAFIILDLGRDRWLSVRSTVGVSSLFVCNDRPAPVPAGVVEAFIAQTKGDVVALDAALQPGQQVRVLSGPFADLVGTLQRLDELGRVRVLLEMMGTAVPISLQRTALMPAA